MSAQEISPAMILLLVGGLLAVGVQLPVINEMLPMAEADVPGFDGGMNLLGGYGDVDSDAIGGWTMLGLDGMILWILVIIGGILCIIPAANKFQPFLPEMEAVPGGLPFLLAIIGGVIQIVFAMLILIGDSEDLDAFGLDMLDPTAATVGFGFYIMLIAAIVCIVGAVLTYLEETAA
ncbi:MAG: hypothetical protein ACXAB4_02980 [Candidatus Hodarchaeales archaeon]|jgi:hypothetical protein